MSISAFGNAGSVPRKWLPRVFAVLSFFYASSAQAHLVSTRFGELYSGMLHPLLALTHIVPWLGLGLLGAVVGSHRSRWALAVFPVSVFIGVFAGSVGEQSQFVAYLNLASFVVLGALVVLNVRLSAAAFMTLSAAIGLFHGYANAAEALGGNARLLYATGVMLSAYFVITLVTAAAHVLDIRAPWGRIALRAAGSWIAAIGLVFGGFTLLT